MKDNICQVIVLHGVDIPCANRPFTFAREGALTFHGHFLQSLVNVVKSSRAPPSYNQVQANFFWGGEGGYMVGYSLLSEAC